MFNVLGKKENEIISFEASQLCIKYFLLLFLYYTFIIVIPEAAILKYLTCIFLLECVPVKYFAKKRYFLL